jgi:hypothetical protein
MEDLTRGPEMTERPQLMAGFLLVLVATGVPQFSRVAADFLGPAAGFAIAVVLWAAAAATGYLIIGKTVGGRSLVWLVVGCGAAWTSLIFALAWFLLRNDASGEYLLPWYTMSAAFTGATYGFLCYIRYRGLPLTLRRATKTSLMASVPAVVMLTMGTVLAAFTVQTTDLASLGMAVFLVFVAPVLLSISLEISWSNIQRSRAAARAARLRAAS